MRLVNWLLIVVLLLPALALATTTVTTDRTNYPSNEIVVLIDGSCSQKGQVGLQVLLGNNMVWVEQTWADPEFSANFSPTAEGNYTLLAACNNDTTKKTNFCFGNCAGGNGTLPLGNGTTSNKTGTYCGDGTCQSNESLTSCPADCKVTPPPLPPGGSSSGSGGKSCTPSWSCGTWSYCGASLKQSRTCSDKKGCEKSYTEIRNCSKCEESWVCSAWSGCASGEQVRACYDEHKCGSTGFKPGLRKSCQAAAAPGPQPASVSPQIPVPPYTPPAESKLSALKPTQVATPFSFTKFWSDYQWYFLGLAALIIAIIVIVVLVAHFAKPQQKVYNLEELKEWIQKEKQMGTNDSQIRQILSQNTSWNEEEISQAFSELNQRG